MAVLDSHIIFNGCANHPETDAGTAGGAINTSKRVEFTDVASAGTLEAVSENAGDTTQNVTATGLDNAGVTLTPLVTLNGQTPAAFTGTFERLLKAVKSASTAGAVAVMATTNTRANTMQAGSAHRSASEDAYCTLDAGASGSDDAYKGQVLRTTGGTGPNQIRMIIRYVGATKRAYVYPDFATLPDGTTTFEVAPGMVFEKSPVEVMEIRRLHIGTASDAPGGSTRNYYDKLFAKNTHGTLALTVAQVIEAADPSGKLTFALATALDDTGTTTNRITTPSSGITAFNSSAKNVANAQNLSPGAAQGIWTNLTLAAGDAPTKTTYSLQVNGQST